MCAVAGRQGSLDAATASKQSAMVRVNALLPAEKASAEAALAEAQVDLDKTFIRAGVDGRVEQFGLRPGDIVNPMIRTAGVLIPEGAGRRALAAGFGQIEAQVMKVGMVAEATCISKPWAIIPLVVTNVQDYIAAGQFRGGEQLIEAQNNVRPGTILVFMEPIYKGGLEGVTPGSSCIANAYTSNHELISSGKIGSFKSFGLHVVDATGLVHALLLRIQAAAASDQDAGAERRTLSWLLHSGSEILGLAGAQWEHLAVLNRGGQNETLYRSIGAADNRVLGRKQRTGQCSCVLPIRFLSRRVYRKAWRRAAAAAGRARRGDPRRRRPRSWRTAGNTDKSRRSGRSSRPALTSHVRSVEERVARLFQGRVEVPNSLIGLPKSEQRAAVTVAAGFVQTHEAPGAVLRVAFLPFEVISLSKIEPDHSVGRAMSLRLSFIAKRAQWRGAAALVAPTITVVSMHIACVGKILAAQHRLNLLNPTFLFVRFLHGSLEC